MELKVRNVNEALYQGMRLFIPSRNLAIRTAPRGMPTLEICEPVFTTYSHPWEKVLFDENRDANPFLHFFEALWMLAGRNDVKFMTQFSKRFVDFSDDGDVLKGAYGHRWRINWYDQIEAVIRELRNDHATRRAVITMWSPLLDMYGGQKSKDIPCNTHIYFKVRDNHLRTTVCCRSNDMVWGAYGTDSVDFAFLHEYIASKVGVKMGDLTQVSDSFHIYEKPHPGGAIVERLMSSYPEMSNPYSVYAAELDPLPMGMESPEWDEDLKNFFFIWDHWQIGVDGYGKLPVLKTQFFSDVVAPMWRAYFTEVHEQRVGHALDIKSPDWSKACVDWLVRRWVAKRNKK